jgi:transcriptional regulator with XRE-family HTH domain
MTSANPYETFIRELKAVRIARGLTQLEVARKVRLSRPQYAAIEHGRSTANFRHIHNLAVALNVRWTIGNPGSRLASRLAKKVE